MTDREKELAVLRAGFDEVAADAWNLAQLAYAERATKCGSPIERLMLAALAYRFPIESGNVFFPAWLSSSRTGGTFALEPQKAIGPYTVDFALTAKTKINGARLARIVIECDGHDFHDRTKEQAARDKSRDRYLASQGWTVLRFTGSEIFRDPYICADAIDDVLQSRLYGHNNDPLERPEQ